MIPSIPTAVRAFNEEQMTWDEHPRGALQVWVPPDWEENYIIGADVALGVRQDYSTAVIMDKGGRVCALFRDNTIDPTKFGEWLFYLGRYYNNALLAVESNSMGIATLTQLKHMNYINMYYETKAAKLSHEETETPGFRMTTGSKPRVIGQLKNCLLYTSPSPRDRTRSRMPSSA